MYFHELYERHYNRVRFAIMQAQILHVEIVDKQKRSYIWLYLFRLFLIRLEKYQVVNVSDKLQKAATWFSLDWSFNIVWMSVQF